MKIKINDKEQAFEEKSLTMAQVLAAAKVPNPQMVSVQLNGEFVKKEDFEKTAVKDGDKIDFLYFMGGG